MAAAFSRAFKKGITFYQPRTVRAVARPTDWAFNDHRPVPFRKNVRKALEKINSVDGLRDEKL
ncbi:MAG: hypothetical protein NZ578_14770 [Candidatus Binatia bacterium]|nr:hypothetical protein [Candidatus Binatia bacterium]